MSRSQFLQPGFLVVTGLIVLAALSRLIQLPWNVAPIAAIALFGGASFASRKAALLIPIVAMAASDVALYATRDSHWLADSWKFVPFTYLSFAAIVGIGLWLRRKPSVGRVMGASLAGSVVFFVVTNFSSWLLFTDYQKNLSGLVECYTMALPFFRNTLAGDLLFNGALFGAFALMQARIPALRTMIKTEAV